MGDVFVTMLAYRKFFPNCAWRANMQMASGSSSTEVAHWTFMRQCTPDQPCWNDLPGTERSIPELLAQCGHS
jgi:hypothetical protein